MLKTETKYLKFLTPDEIAERLAITKATVLRLIRRGELKALRISSRTLRISESAFEEFAAKRSSQDQPQDKGKQG